MKILVWFAFETFAFFKLCDHFGFLNVAFWYFIPSVIGIYFLQVNGFNISQQAQQILRQEENPNKNIIHNLLKMFGSILLIIPSIITRFFAILFLTPGLRHLIVLFLLHTGLKKFTKWTTSKNFGSFYFYSNIRTANPIDSVQLLPEDDEDLVSPAILKDVTPPPKK